MNKIITLLALISSGLGYANYGNQDNSAQYGSTSIHQDTRYMYNYRLGNSGAYTYNYDVEDMNGSGAYGNCNMTGKYGDCTIVNENGDEVQAEAEWIRNGVMIVSDEDGNEYEMEAQ